MIAKHTHSVCLMMTFLLGWLALFILPFALAFGDLFSCDIPASDSENLIGITLQSLGLASLIAILAVILGAIPGKILAMTHKPVRLLLILVIPLILPRYVQYYAWSLLLSPTTALGKFLSGHSELAQTIGSGSAISVLLFWYWPVAALLLARGWNALGDTVFDVARLETTHRQRFFHITLPLLGRDIVLSFAVCFILVLSEFSTFHLAGVKTVGTSLAVLYEATGSEAAVLRAALPLVFIAIAVGYFLHRELIQTSGSSGPSHKATVPITKYEWLVLGILLAVSVICPILILVMNIHGSQAFIDFIKLHSDELIGSLLSSSAAVVFAFLLAYGAKQLSSLGHCGRLLRGIVYTSIFAGILLPGSLVGIYLLKSANLAGTGWSQGWWMVSAGQAVRVCGIALILLELNRKSDDCHVKEMAQLDGAGPWARFRYIYLPQQWPFIAAVFLLLLMISVTELPATMVLLGAGVPNFAQRLLNQMHYARDDQVIASCLILISVFMVLSAVAVGLLKRAGRAGLVLILAGMCCFVTGCDKISAPKEAHVVRMFGSTGRGRLEFMYPRAITFDGEKLYVIDKAGRIQMISPEGDYLGEYQMPEIEAGKPTGMSISPQGDLYVADTHYHRIVAFNKEGTIIQKFGQFGEGDGEFIYPTDVTFDKTGRIFVSEYGGNDRISVFDKDGTFQYCFGEPGNGEGQFSRPSAICIDPSNENLYIADACNHRIAVYTLDGKLVRYLGHIGTEPGCLRYPYDFDLSDNEQLVICEYGNNRVQIMDTQGRSHGVYGRAGRNPGELAYPWGVAIDHKNAYIVDAGNNRIQVWEL